MAAKLVITQRRSSAGTNGPQRDTLRSLGLHGIGTTTEREDNPALRGMLRRVAHLIDVQDAKDAASA
jgi:large subunit ribosomal protein L30